MRTASIELSLAFGQDYTGGGGYSECADSMEELRDVAIKTARLAAYDLWAYRDCPNRELGIVRIVSIISGIPNVSTITVFTNRGIFPVMPILTLRWIISQLTKVRIVWLLWLLTNIPVVTTAPSLHSGRNDRAIFISVDGDATHAAWDKFANQIGSDATVVYDGRVGLLT
jgi:hypothetical protein